MKKVFIIHGWDGSPNSDFIPWLKKELEKIKFSVIVPAMPNPAAPEITSWVNVLKKYVGVPDDNTFFIGHSIGCQTILRFLEKIPENISVGGVILVAPWIKLKKEVLEEEEGTEEIASPWMKTPINWNKVKSQTEHFISIFSEDDPFVPLEDSEIFKDKLKSKIIIEKNKGHFNIKKLPIVLEQIIKLS